MGRVLTPLLIYLGVSYVVVILYTLFTGAVGMPGDFAGTSAASSINASLTTSLAAVCSFPLLWHMWKRNRVPSQVRNHWLLPVSFFCGVLASCAGSFLLEQSHIKEIFSNQVQEELFSGHIAVQLFGLGIAVPVVEELLYRGLVYHRLSEFLPKRAAILAAILLFAISHGNMIQIIYALPMAALLHWFYEKSATLAAPVLFHMGANLISIVLQYFSSR